MWRGLMDIAEPFVQFKDKTAPYVGTAVEAIKDAIPRVADPENAYWIYKGELPSFKGIVVGMADALSTLHPNYLLVAATFVAAFIALYIKTKYPFWNQIPALHVYDWHRRFLYSKTPYIIHLLPKKTKYYEPNLVKTKLFQNSDSEEKTELAIMLQNYYLPSDRVFCSIQVPDLAAQCSNALISTYYQVQDDIVFDRELVVQEKRTMEGFITSRKINVAVLTSTETVAYEPANYMDYLCFSKKSVSPQKIRKLFHTHEYNTRMMYPDRNITLFKKEVELCDAIIPLVEYESRTFYLRHQIEPSKLPKNFRVVRIQRDNLQNLYDWTERVASLRESGGTGFKVSITAEIGDLVHLLQTNQMFAYILRGPDVDVPTKLDTVYAMYFFRNAHMKYEDLDGGDTLHAVCAFCNTNDFELFFLGFVWAVRDARKDFSGTETKMMMIDNIGHLNPVSDRWMQTHTPVLRTKCAYYFCNYIVPSSTYRREEVNVLI